VGDPGSGKSDCARWFAKHLAPRYVFVTASESSRAGLTLAWVKDEDGAWGLNCGALVKASKGIAILDEAQKYEKADQEALHEVLQNQSVSSSKLGQPVVVPTNTTVWWIQNGKYGRFDPNESFLDQFTFEPALMSRFPAIFLVVEQPDDVRAERIAEAMQRKRLGGEVLAKKHQEDVDFLRKYVNKARTIIPEWQADALRLAAKKYVEITKIRKSDGARFPTTPRHNEGLMRWAEAHARLMHRTEVTKADVLAAFEIIAGEIQNAVKYVKDYADAFATMNSKDRAIEHRIKDVVRDSVPRSIDEIVRLLPDQDEGDVRRVAQRMEREEILQRKTEGYFVRWG
jgi:DNA replicative helicase MCM subunit Mcm2 (Cdc46/Mcm family)